MGSPDAYDSAGTKRSPAADYVKFLPKSIPLPTFYTEEERDSLIGTSLSHALEQKLASLEREFEQLRELTAELSWCQRAWWSAEHGVMTFDDWKLADAMYRSRALELPHGVGDSMVPVLDMANHASDNRSNARFEVDENGNVLLLVRDDKTIAPEEEITIMYGVGGACEMIFSYGFLEEGASSAREMFLSLSIPEDDPLRLAKIRYAKEAPGVRVYVTATGDVEWDSNYLWWACVNEEDGLDFRIMQTNDGERELRAVWKEEDFDPHHFRDILAADNLWSVFALRANVLIQQRFESQGAELTGTEQSFMACEDRISRQVWLLVKRLRELELDLITAGFLQVEEEKDKLLASPMVRSYLGVTPASDDDGLFARFEKGSSSLSPGTAAQVKAEIESSRDDVLYVEIPAPVQNGAHTTGASTVAAFVESFEQKIQEHEKRPANISASTLISETAATKHVLTNASKTPPRILSDQYINLFFQEWQPLFPVLHRPTFLRVYENYLAGPDAGNWQSNKQAIAQLFLIFEIAALSSGHQLKSNCPTYENQWRRALYATSAAPNVAAIQSHVLAQLCYLLRGDYPQLARHRGIAVGMCHQLGLHQGHKYHTHGVFEAETRRKVFWCQYTLDKFASAATGSPSLLRESDITTEYPADVDDENLTSQGFSPALPGETTKISSALAMFKASRILSKTLDHLYSSKASYELSISKLHTYSDDLDNWSEELPEHLRLRFSNDKPATNVISCRSPLLSLTYFYIRGLIHRPLLCHGTGSAQAAATIVLAAAGKHTLQILDLLDERRMNYTFPINKRELLLTSGLSILWQSIDLDEDSKLIKDNQKSLQLALTMLSRESQTSYAEFRRIATAFIPLQSRRTSGNKDQGTSPKTKSKMPAPTPHAAKPPKSTKKQLQAIASRFSTAVSSSSRSEEPRRATVAATNLGQSMSPPHRAGSTVSLSSTRSAPVAIACSPNQLVRTNTTNSNQSINLDYFAIGDDQNSHNTADHQTTSASSSTMLPPKKPIMQQVSPTIANASWDNLLLTNPHYSASMTNINSTNNVDFFNSPNMAVHTPMSMTGAGGSNSGNEWLQDNGNWNLPAMDFSTKANVPQSLLSFSGESITSGDDFLFSASSHNGSTSTNESRGSGSGTGIGGARTGSGDLPTLTENAFKGIAIPVDDEFDFDVLEG
ncbi:Transcriptional activator protein acu-15 [Cyphellophora attinorum]|uniref:Transcriptional activator protein acu-15 n=1 Tax=Cyphellophora attinorum TaxID=1664694 RepID=A0A0N0NQ37_9EURO|nr:Transcriptional activator protein acu-15 [Phialophora attinorum]KPI43249.1 Transcriptional activator protein acu-15 [Phialophora attinorum]